MKQSKTMKRVLASVLAVAMLLGLVGPVEKARAEGAVDGGAVSLVEYSATPQYQGNKRIRFTPAVGVPSVDIGNGIFAEGTTGFTTRNGEDFNGMSYIYCYPGHGFYQLIMDDSYEKSPTQPGDVIIIEGTYTQTGSGFSITFPKTQFKCMGSESEGYYWEIIEDEPVEQDIEVVLDSSATTPKASIGDRFKFKTSGTDVYLPAGYAGSGTVKLNGVENGGINFYSNGDGSYLILHWGAVQAAGDVVTIEGTYGKDGVEITLPKTRFKCFGSESEGYYWKIIENVDVVTYSAFTGFPAFMKDAEGNTVSIQGKTFLANISYTQPTDGAVPEGTYTFTYGCTSVGWDGLYVVMTRTGTTNTLQIKLRPRINGTVQPEQLLASIVMTDEEITQSNLLRIDFPTADKDGCGYLNVSLNGKKVVDNAYIKLTGYENCLFKSGDGNYSITISSVSASVLAQVEKIEVPKAEVDAITLTDFSHNTVAGNMSTVLQDGKVFQGNTFVAKMKYETSNLTNQKNYNALYLGSITGTDEIGICIYMEKCSDGTYDLSVRECVPGSSKVNILATYNMAEAEILATHILRVDFPEADENNQGYLTVCLDDKRLVDHYLLSNVSEYGTYIKSVRANLMRAILSALTQQEIDTLKALSGPRANVAYIEQPKTGIVNPAVVVTKVDSSNISNLKGSSVAIMDIDSSLNILDGTTTIGTVTGYMKDYEETIIPAFYLDSAEEVTAICNYLNKNNIIDAFYVVSRENAALLKTARQTWKYARGIIEYDAVPADFEARATTRREMHENLAFIGIFPKEDLTADITAEYNIRGLSVWSYAQNAGDVYEGISDGANGLIASTPKLITDVYESITVRTLSGKPMAIAHRGTGAAALYPENTITAYKAMVEKHGAAACEMDLNITKDGTLILLTDSTVDRATDGTGNVIDMTDEEVKALTVDISKAQTGLTDKIPTLEEVFEVFKGTDTVLYLHLNHITGYSTIKDKLPDLVEKHGMEDNVVVFDRGRNYTYSIALAYAGGGTEKIQGTDEYYAIESLIKDLGPDNEQMLPSSDSGIGTKDSLVYAMSARGMLTLNSTTDGEANLDKYLITEKGNTAILTNVASQISDYHYEIKAQDTAFVTGELIDLSQKVKKIVGDATVSCGLVQVGGDTLVESAEGYTLTSAGSAEVVYYADITLTRSYGNLTYRLYSAPVTVKMVEGTYLGDPNFDGQHTVVDLIKTKKATLQTKPSLGLYDIHKDEVVDLLDVSRMRELILGIFRITN